jgi:hypothetical protein
MKTFNSAAEMATWINNNIQGELQQEQLMYLGVKNKKLNGSYTIII